MTYHTLELYTLWLLDQLGIKKESSNAERDITKTLGRKENLFLRL